MTNSELSTKRIISGVCVVVVAALIIWLCGTTVTHGTRISLNEKSSIYIEKTVDEIKTMIGDLTDEIRKGR